MTDTDSDERERIRERKRERLLDERGDGESTANGSASAATPDEPVAVSGMDEFRQVVADHDTVLVDCYADWCGPCQMMEPVVADVAATTDATVAKVDVDANQDIAAELGARSIPTFVLFVDGEPAERLVGAQDQSTVEQLIARA